jgi:hypothetical protein
MPLTCVHIPNATPPCEEIREKASLQANKKDDASAEQTKLPLKMHYSNST